MVIAQHRRVEHTAAAARRRAVPLLVLSGAVLGLLLAIGATVLILNMRAAVLREADRSLGRLAAVLADQADRALQAVDLVQDSVVTAIGTEGIATPAEFAARLATRSVHETLALRIAGLPQIDALSLVDASGSLTNSSRAWPNAVFGVTDRDYFQALRSDPTLTRFISRPVTSRGDGTWTIVVVRRVTAANGGFLGLVLVLVDLDYFERLYAAAAPNRTFAISLLRDDGTLLAREPPNPAMLGRRFPGALAASHAAAGADWLAATSVVAHFPLRVNVSTTAAAALSAWRTRLRVQIPTLIGMELALAGLVLLGVRQVRSQARLAGAEERARGARELSRQYARFGTALDNMSQGLCMFDADQLLEVANRRLADMFGQPAPPPCGTPLPACLARLGGPGALRPREQRRAAAAIRRLVARRQPAHLVWELTGGRTLAISFQPLGDGGWLLTCEDVTEQRQAARRLDFLAHHDPLTRLPNRAVFRERLDHAVCAAVRGPACAVFCLDIDRLKEVNDALGHAAGDRLLADVAARLRRCVQENDTLARLGGDQFALIQTGMRDAQDATRQALRILDGLRRPFDIGGERLAIGASIGIAIAPSDSIEPETLLRQADIALHRAKADARGGFRFFDAATHAQLEQQRALAADLPRALGAGQLELFYQPLVLVATRQVVGCEALLRWRHPARGLVLPGAFVPRAEETGLIVPIGAWALERACRDAALWPAPLKVAVNLSAAQFASGTLVATVAQALTRSGLPPARLELEITETALLLQSGETLAALHALRALGVAIVMDDFGAGYSSLSYLRQFPFDKVKVDRGFIQDFDHRREAAAILRAMTGLCRQLDIITLVEGVETEEQFAALVGEACTEVQGFLFGAPCPAAEVRGMVERFGRAVAETVG